MRQFESFEERQIRKDRESRYKRERRKIELQRAKEIIAEIVDQPRSPESRLHAQWNTRGHEDMEWLRVRSYATEQGRSSIGTYYELTQKGIDLVFEIARESRGD